jgi:hypothetical protein
MDKFVRDENLKLFQKRLTETTDEKQRQVLHNLIAEQKAEYYEWRIDPLQVPCICPLDADARA